MTEVDMMFQVAASRIQGLTAKVNHWKRRANELEAALGVEKAARAHAESCRYLAESEAKAREWGTENKRLRAEVADLEKQRDGFATQVQDMRNEIARLRADLRTMSDRSNGSEWEKKAVELEELRAELNLVKQERDCAKSEWDRAEGRCKTLGGEVAELFSDRQRLKAELAVIKDERNELRAKLEAIEAKIKASTCEPNTPTPRSHPVKVGEWVKNDNGDVRQVRQVREVYAEYLLTTGWRWAFEHCTPCDPPESTEQMMLRREREFAVKEAAANALEDRDDSSKETSAGSVLREGDHVEIWRDTVKPFTRQDEVGLRGSVAHIRRDESTGSMICEVRCHACGMPRTVGLDDVRKIQREPKPGDVVRLVRVPTNDEYPHDSGRWEPNWGGIGDYMRVHYVGSNSNGTRVVRAVFGLEWPLSCIEIVDVK